MSAHNISENQWSNRATNAAVIALAIHPADAGISTIISLRRRKGSVQGGL